MNKHDVTRSLTLFATSIALMGAGPCKKATDAGTEAVVDTAPAGTAPSDLCATPSTLLEQTSQSGGGPMPGWSVAQAQTFAVSTASKFTSIELALQEASGTHNATLEVYAYSGGSLDALGTPLASVTKALSNTSTQWVSFDIPNGGLQLQAGTYILKLVQTTGSLTVWGAPSGDPYAGGMWFYKNGSGFWFGLSDMAFRFNGCTN